MNYINPIFLTDSYKLSHLQFTSKGVQVIYSNFTPRFTEYLEAKFKTFDGGIVWFGLQAAIKKIVYEYWEDNFFNKDKGEVIGQAKQFLGRYIGMENLSHFEDLHDLGYLPIRIKSLPEGCVISKGIPCFTITNTRPDYQWLPNYLESVFSAEVWKPMTTATIGRTLKLLATEASIETTGSAEGAEFQLHDFSFRGQSGIESGAASGGGMLLSTMGTDNIPSIAWMEHYYNADIMKDDIAHSVAAGEHSVTTLGIQIESNKLKRIASLGYEDLTEDDYLYYGEVEYVKYVVKQFPTGIVSYVADSYDYFKFLDKVLPELKDVIESRDGKFVVRGDSGNPVDIIAGIEIKDYSGVENFNLAAIDAVYGGIDTNDIQDGLNCVVYSYKGRTLKVCANVEVDEYGLLKDVKIIDVNSYELTTQEMGTISKLFEIFGGVVNHKGYIELSEKIGMIYGDGINEERMLEIFKRLKAKGFATTNVVFGIGSYTLNMLSRDDLGTAIKATSSVVNDEVVSIYKDPKTDSSKKSARGLLKVQQLPNGVLELQDEVSVMYESEGMLGVVFEDGCMYNETDYNSVLNTLKNYNDIWINNLK